MASVAIDVVCFDPHASRGPRPYRSVGRTCYERVAKFHAQLGGSELYSDLSGLTNDLLSPVALATIS